APTAAPPTARRSTKPWPPDTQARAERDQGREAGGLTGLPDGASSPRLPVPVADPGAERLAVQLPDAGERHRVEDGHLARVLVGAGPRPGEPGNLRRGRLAAGPQRDERHALLAEARVGPAHHACHRDRGMLEQDVLHITREDVETAPEDQVLLPVHHIQV